MIIFFDYPDDGLDGSPDHTAIVEKAKDGRVYTVEGNYNDKVATDDYAISYPYIFGYGVPQYWKREVVHCGQPLFLQSFT